MDPFSLATGIADLLGVIFGTIKCAQKYISTIKNRKESITTFIIELEALRENLTNLQSFLQSTSAREFSFGPDSVLHTCQEACKVRLTGLYERLSRTSISKAGALLWPLNEKEHQKVITDLRNFTQWIHLALSVGGCTLLSRSSEDVLKTLQGQLEGFKELQDSTSRLTHAVESQSKTLHKLEDEARFQKRERLLKWISEIDHDKKHHSVRQDRVANTGTWLLERSEYKDWTVGSTFPNVLWCHGVGGSGKSVLTSMIIDELKQSSSLRVSNATLRQSAALAVIYFDYKETNQQDLLIVLSSILKQFLATIAEVPKHVSEAYEKSQRSGAQWPVEEIEELIFRTVAQVNLSTIVVDALDECVDLRHRKAFLSFLRRFIQAQNTRLFLTSRQGFLDITEVFSVFPQIKITAHDSDLERYMRQDNLVAKIYDVADQAFANKVIATVIQKAQGMFLLAKLHYDTILDEPTAGDMSDALDSLEPSLDSAFEKTVSRIRQLPHSRRQLGLDVLMWLCLGKGSMYVAELSDAMSVKPGQTALRPEHRPRPGIMLECCQGLVATDKKAAQFHLAHYSIQEYLMRHLDDLVHNAKVSVATTCLTYLRFDVLKEGPCEDESEILQRIQTYPFLSYASEYWGVHVQELNAPDLETTKHILHAFLNCQNAIASADQISQYNKGYRDEYFDAEECITTTALHISSHFGLDNILLDLLESKNLDINTVTTMGTTAIIKAASRGHVASVKLLLERGADPNLENWYGNALHCAAEAGKSVVIKDLLGFGMDPNARTEDGRSALECAMDNDSGRAFETLITTGADISAVNENGRNGYSLFHQAAGENCFNIINVILKHGWGDLTSKSETGRTVLHHAAAGGHALMVQKLILSGADFKAEDDAGFTPLQILEDAQSSKY